MASRSKDVTIKLGPTGEARSCGCKVLPYTLGDGSIVVELRMVEPGMKTRRIHNDPALVKLSREAALNLISEMAARLS